MIAMTHQTLVALILVIAAVLLLIRQIARMISGKNAGCSCNPWKKKSCHDDSSDTP